MTANTSRGYTYPQSTDHVRLWEHMQELATDINTDVDVIAKPPAGRLVQQSGATQGPFSSGTLAAITFGASSEELDTHGFHSTSSNTTRVTPTVAGWYRVNGAVSFTGSGSYTSLEARIRTNGATNIAPAGKISPGAGSATQVIGCSTLVSCNGSGDYFELIGVGTGASWSTVVSSQYASVLEWKYERGL